MRETREGRASAIWTALAAGSFGYLAPALTEGERLAWVIPLLCVLPALGIGAAWKRVGEMTETVGKPVLFLYYVWALVLLLESGMGYAARLRTTAHWDSPWLFLGAAAALSLWLCRGAGTIPARAGRLLFLAVAAVLILSLALSLPGLRWENLWPVRGEDLEGVPEAILFWLSLSGYGVYGLFLPKGGGRSWPWTVAIGAMAAGLLLALTGSFGAPLAGERAEPILLLLEGVRVPGVFRHGEAALEGGLALADLTLMAVLTYGCKAIWSKIAPGAPVWLGLLPPAAAIAGAGLLPPQWQRELTAFLIPAGNLALGTLAPAAAALLKTAGEWNTGRPILCGESGQKT